MKLPSKMKVYVFTFICVSQIIQFTAVAGSEFGDECDPTNANPTLRCRSDAWLTCNNATLPPSCECEPNMVLGTDRSNCVSKIGGPCQKHNLGQQIRNCTESALCLTGDDGNTTICQCHPGYIPLPNNLVCSLSHGQQCVKSDDCSLNALLTCQNGMCLCEERGSQVWDDRSSKCLALVGGSCNENETAFIKKPCVSNAICNNDSQQCECNLEGFKETSDKKCLLDYSRNCTRTGECHPHFQCIVRQGNESEPCGQCLCDNSVSDYSEEYGICEIRAGHRCGISEEDEFCIEHAICSTRYKICQCEPGYRQSSDGHCLGGYRNDCHLPTDRCDMENKLECKNETKSCDCMNNYIYSSTVQKCVGLVGGNCMVNSDCYEIAVCNNSTSTCVCSEGYSSTPNSRCLLSFGKYCFGPSTPCNTYNFLNCHMARRACECEDSDTMEFDAVHGKCVGLAGHECFTAPIDSRLLECVGNATCIARTNDTSNTGLCVCNSEYENDAAGGKCVPKTSSPGTAGNLVIGNWVMAILLIVGLSLSDYLSLKL